MFFLWIRRPPRSNRTYTLFPYTTLFRSPFTGRQNSAYIAGLAYDSHTRDMRPTMEGKQTISTYWVDVRENQILEPREKNQYWLATKYGGFRVPGDYGDPYARTESLPEISSEERRVGKECVRPCRN